MNNNYGTFGALLISFMLINTPNSGAEDWPQFLGTHRNGVSSEKELVSNWPADGPKVVWRTPLGVGMSGMAISEGRVYTLFQDEQNQFLVALKAADGRELWRTPVAPMYENAMGNGPRGTPTVSGSTICVFTGEGVLAVVQKSDGKPLWSVNVPKSLGGAPSEYGMSCSPLVVDDRVIVHAGTPSAAVAAYELKSGKALWQAGHGKAGYSSPIMMELGGVRQVVSLTAAGVLGVDPAEGKVLWSYPFSTEYDCNTANPVQLDESSLLISAGENHGSVILKISRTNAEFKAEEAWSSLGKDSQLRAEWQTPVICNGYLFGLDNSGSAGPITNLVCLRLEDHQTMWQKNRFGKSNLILADGRLYLTTMNGEVVIIDASPEEFRELGRAQIMETTRQAPALANGHLFVRDDQEIICIDIRKK